MKILKIVPLIIFAYFATGCEEIGSTDFFNASNTSNGSNTSNVPEIPEMPETSCDLCRSDETVILRWIPDSPNVIGYKIYYRAEPYHAERELSDLNSTTQEFSLLSPSISYHAWNDLNLYEGDNVCFRIRSYTDDGSDDFSQETCGRLPKNTQSV